MKIISPIFRWQQGRQQSGYHKMLLCGAYWPIKFDVYLLKFPKGSVIPPHTDKVEKGKHYRLGAVELCCSIFVLFEHAFIAALNMWPSNLSEY
ncbi:hypothetical protein [Pseudoalteromonas sp. MMG013]|uniref:hypothetical protein n=1 Tax=Pseudoalteromonas sp. MMG013 TaxID=2822687 RepID=UPI001FFD0EA1|nr:hypothetical protein [Pseudoalteromonas sp. MMG013]